MATASNPDVPVKATCHCGAVTVQVPSKPSEINECQCTICRRYGAEWAYYDPRDVQVSASSPTKAYIWGDRDLEFHFCSNCGCVVYWKSIEESDKMGVNTRMMIPDNIKDAIRGRDQAILTMCLRSKDTAHPEDQAQY